MDTARRCRTCKFNFLSHIRKLNTVKATEWKYERILCSDWVQSNSIWAYPILLVVIPTEIQAYGDYMDIYCASNNMNYQHHHDASFVFQNHGLLWENNA